MTTYQLITNKINMYLKRAKEALDNDELKSCNEYNDKANALIEIREEIELLEKSKREIK